MNKAMFKILTAACLLGCCALSWAQDQGTAQKQDRATKDIREKAPRVVPADPNKARRRAKIQELRRKGRNRELREKRRKELLKKLKDRQKTRGRDLPIVKGPAQRRQVDALRKRITRQEAKHLRRTARLKRIRQLAKAKNAAEIVGRVDDLLNKEKMRHDRVFRQLRQRMHMFTRMETIEQGGPMPGREKLRQKTQKAPKNKLDRNSTPPKTKSKETAQ
jgi:hypothetical protein